MSMESERLLTRVHASQAEYSFATLSASVVGVLGRKLLPKCASLALMELGSLGFGKDRPGAGARDAAQAPSASGGAAAVESVNPWADELWGGQALAAAEPWSMDSEGETAYGGSDTAYSAGAVGFADMGSDLESYGSDSYGSESYGSESYGSDSDSSDYGHSLPSALSLANVHSNTVAPGFDPIFDAGPAELNDERARADNDGFVGFGAHSHTTAPAPATDWNSLAWVPPPVAGSRAPTALPPSPLPPSAHAQVTTYRLPLSYGSNSDTNDYGHSLSLSDSSLPSTLDLASTIQEAPPSVEPVEQACPFCKDDDSTKEHAAADSGVTRLRRQRSKPRKAIKFGQWWKAYGYDGPCYCQRCSELFRDHCIRQLSNSAGCSRGDECPDCAKILGHFGHIKRSEIWAHVDAREQANKLKRKAREEAKGATPHSKKAKRKEKPQGQSLVKQAKKETSKLAAASLAMVAVVAVAFTFHRLPAAGLSSDDGRSGNQPVMECQSCMFGMCS